MIDDLVVSTNDSMGSHICTHIWQIKNIYIYVSLICYDWWTNWILGLPIHWQSCADGSHTFANPGVAPNLLLLLLLTCLRIRFSQSNITLRSTMHGPFTQLGASRDCEVCSFESMRLLPTNVDHGLVRLYDQTTSGSSITKWNPSSKFKPDRSSRVPLPLLKQKLQVFVLLLLTSGYYVRQIPVWIAWVKV